MSRRAAVLGASGHAKVVIATLQAAGWEVVSAWDDSEQRRGEEVLGVPILGPLEGAAEAGADGFVIAIGDNRDRRRIAEALDLPWISVVHPAAVVHPSVALGPGAVVFAGAVIQPDTEVGRHAIVNTAASVDHDCRLGDFVHVAPGCRLGGGVTVGEGTLLGIGTSVLPGIAIGAWSVIGAGSAVIADLGSRVTAYGSPARVQRRDGAPPDPPGGADG
jgi:sugar O-acyltransferase (sialic acid O-acetyltransferase NeuD family)